MSYPLYKDGKIKMYWEDFKSPKEFLSDQVEGLEGVRKWLLDIIPDNESILDIGCGPGHVSEIFRSAGRNNSYIGVDNYERVLNYAKSLFPHVDFRNMDANFLSFPDNSQDNCILFTVIEMMPDFRKPIEEAVRVAKKKVIITTFTKPTNERTINLHTVSSHGDYILEINERDLTRHLDSFGYKVRRGELSDRNGTTQYWYWIIEK